MPSPRPKKSAKKPAAKKAPAKKSAAKPSPKPSTKKAPASRVASPKSTPKSASDSRFSKKPSGGGGGGGSASKRTGSGSNMSPTAPASSPTAAPTSARKPGNPYSVHPGVQMMVKWAAELKPKTGRSLEEWVALLKKEAPAAFQDRVAFLKSKHAMGTNAAWWIAERADGKGAEDLDPDLYLAAATKYVDEQFEGKKAALRPVYDTLLSLCLSMDPRAKACPCKTIVPIYIGNVVAQLKATTNTRIDLGLALGDTKASGRLIDTGGFAKKDRITHRIEITKAGDIDDFVKKWIAAAYSRA